MVDLLHPVLIALLAIFFMVAIRGYKKYIGPYTAFRSTLMVYKVVLDFITGKKLGNMTPSAYYTKMIEVELKKSLAEGMLVAWIPKPYLLIYNEEAVKIFSSSQTTVSKPELYHVLQHVLGFGLIPNSNGELWRKRRRMIQPAFHAAVTKSYTSIFNKNAAAFVEQLRMAADEPIEIIRPVQKCCFDNLLSTVFGMDIDDPVIKAELQELPHLFDELAGLFSGRMLNPLLHIKWTLPLFSVGRRFLKCKKETRVIFEKVLLRTEESLQRKKALHSDAEQDNYYGDGVTLRKSFPELLVDIHLQDPSFTREDMIDECNAMLFGGYETVSYAMMWCLFLLGCHQDVQDRAYNEVENLTGDELSWEDVQNLTYIECVLKEALRLYSAVPAYARILEEDVQCGKHKIPKGTNIVFLAYMFHRNPAVYPNPEKFDPERFRNNADRNHGIFIPFSEGVRNCIGKQHAMIQMKITLAYILQNFKLISLQREEDIQVGWEIILTACPKILLRFMPRCHNSKQG